MTQEILGHLFSKYGLQTSNIRILWELVRNGKNEPLPQTHSIKNTGNGLLSFNQLFVLLSSTSLYQNNYS